MRALNEQGARSAASRRRKRRVAVYTRLGAVSDRAVRVDARGASTLRAMEGTLRVLQPGPRCTEPFALANVPALLVRAGAENIKGESIRP